MGCKVAIPSLSISCVRCGMFSNELGLEKGRPNHASHPHFMHHLYLVQHEFGVVVDTACAQLQFHTAGCPVASRPWLKDACNSCRHGCANWCHAGTIVPRSGSHASTQLLSEKPTCLRVVDLAEHAATARARTTGMVRENLRTCSRYHCTVESKFG